MGGKKKPPAYTKPESPRLIKTGEILASGEEKTIGRAMVKAGYAESTARVPKAHGVTAAKALAALRKSKGGQSKSAQHRLVKKADELLGGVMDTDTLDLRYRIAAAKVVKDAAKKDDPQSETGIPDLRDKIRFRAAIMRGIQKGILLGLTEVGNEHHATDVANRLGDKLQELSRMMEELSDG